MWSPQRAREHGMTSEELAALVAMPVYRIRTLTSVADLDQLPVAALRTLATELHLPLPAWLTPHESWPDLCDPDSLHDPVRLQAVLLTAQGQHLHLSDIAQVLDWTITGYARPAPAVASGHSQGSPARDTRCPVRVGAAETGRAD